MDNALARKPHGDSTGAREGASLLLAHRRPERRAVDGEEAAVILEDVSGLGLDDPGAKLELADPRGVGLTDRREGDRGVHRAPAAETAPVARRRAASKASMSDIE
jgi:hypothetical protein